MFSRLQTPARESGEYTAGLYTGNFSVYHLTMYDVLDLDRYPIHEFGRARTQTLIDDCKDQLARHGNAHNLLILARFNQVPVASTQALLSPPCH